MLAIGSELVNSRDAQSIEVAMGGLRWHFSVMTQSSIYKNVLCLDIGSGTQDVLYYRSGSKLENCPKFVLPAPARQVGARIRDLTAAKQAVHLHGWNMGGGFYRDVKAHLEAGLAM